MNEKEPGEITDEVKEKYESLKLGLYNFNQWVKDADWSKTVVIPSFPTRFSIHLINSIHAELRKFPKDSEYYDIYESLLATQYLRTAQMHFKICNNPSMEQDFNAKMGCESVEHFDQDVLKPWDQLMQVHYSEACYNAGASITYNPTARASEILGDVFSKNGFYGSANHWYKIGITIANSYDPPKQNIVDSLTDKMDQMNSSLGSADPVISWNFRFPNEQTDTLANTR